MPRSARHVSQTQAIRQSFQVGDAGGPQGLDAAEVAVLGPLREAAVRVTARFRSSRTSEPCPVIAAARPSRRRPPPSSGTGRPGYSGSEPPTRRPASRSASAYRTRGRSGCRLRERRGRAGSGAAHASRYARREPPTFMISSRVPFTVARVASSPAGASSRASSTPARAETRSRSRPRRRAAAPASRRRCAAARRAPRPRSRAGPAPPPPGSTA